MVNSVVSGPMEDGALVGHGVGQHEIHPERERGLVGSVTPQSVNPSGDSDASDRPEDEGPQKSVWVALVEREQSDDGGHMREERVYDHGPVKIVLLVVATHGRNGFG